MKKIIIMSFVLIVTLFAIDKADSNSSTESNENNQTKKSLYKIESKPLHINLDKLKKTNNLKNSSSKAIKGTIIVSDNKVHVKGWSNDEVSNKGICLNGTKRTLYRGDFKLVIKNGKKNAFEKQYKEKNNICISTTEIKKGTSLEIINSKKKILVKFDIEKI